MDMEEGERRGESASAREQKPRFEPIDIQCSVKKGFSRPVVLIGNKNFDPPGIKKFMNKKRSIKWICSVLI